MLPQLHDFADHFHPGGLYESFQLIEDMLLREVECGVGDRDQHGGAMLDA
jgi:hypothetical protein